MRFLCSLLLSSVLVLEAGCSAPPTITYLAPDPQPTPLKVPPASLVVTNADAVNVARNVLEKAGTRWLEPPTARVVEQMSYVEARRRVQVLGEADDALWPQDTPLWLVVLQGRWRLLPYGQTQGAPAPEIYQGCGYVLFTARDGTFVAAGDTPCPAQP